MKATRLGLMWLLLVATTGTAATPPTLDWTTLALSPLLRQLLSTGRWGATPTGFRIVTLSFLADGCAAEGRRDPTKRPAARACVNRCIELANRTGHRPPRVQTDDGLWLTHYALILGAADALGACANPQLHAEIAAALAQRSLHDPHRHVASYTQRRHRWPADQTATLASLARYDRAHGASLHQTPAQQWREYMLGKAIDRRLGLPWSEVTGTDHTAKEPRGCALSWQTRFLHEFDDALARQWWLAYRGHFLVDHLGLAGFREWAPGRDFGMDNDSGPIVNGIGAAATGLALAAARVMNDDELATKIERAAAVAGTFASALPQSRGALPDAIRYLGAQIRP